MAPRIVTWAEHPDPSDLDKAARYLTLLGLWTPPVVNLARGRVFYPAKDILRAMGQQGGAQLPADNAGVAKWSARMKAGDEIPCVLILEGAWLVPRPLVLPEGYHRLCSAWLREERTPVAAFFLA